MAKKQMRYKLSAPLTKKHKTHIVFATSLLSVCGSTHSTCKGNEGRFAAAGKPLTLAAINKRFVKAPNPCARCEIFAFHNIK